jgi:hypothetical protein
VRHVRRRRLSSGPFDGVWLHLATTEPGTCRIAADQIAVETNLCAPAIPVRSAALIQGGSIAYMTLTRLDSEWDRDRSVEPAVTATQTSPMTEPTADGPTIIKPCTQLFVTY